MNNKGDYINGIYISQYNMMFEWNESEVSKTGIFPKKFYKFHNKLWTNRQTVPFGMDRLLPNTSSRLEIYCSKAEKMILEHVYSDRVKVRIDPFEYSYHIYETIKNYFIHHEGFIEEVGYIPSPFAVFVRDRDNPTSRLEAGGT